MNSPQERSHYLNPDYRATSAVLFPKTRLRSLSLWEVLFSPSSLSPVTDRRITGLGGIRIERNHAYCSNKMREEIRPSTSLAL